MICSRPIIFMFILSVFVTIQVSAKQEFSVIDAIRNAFLSKDGDVNCNNMKACPEKTTCCEANVPGSFGCCDFQNATCCSDKRTCCPSGYRCSVEKHICYAEISDNTDVSSKELQPLSGTSESILSDVACPDGISFCPNGNTCCKVSSGQYGCCPLPKAVCCSDNVHCCPNGYTCSSGGFCNKHGVMTKALRKTAAKILGDVICPDHTSSCPDGTTCCKLASGGYGCCPYSKATCCSDGVHCCPNGYSCNISNGTCTKNGLTMKAVSKLATIGDVICPGGKSSCPDGTTCCKLLSGQYGCCPLPKAICCSDGVHCCPNGYTCDVSQGTCMQGGLSVQAVSKIASISNVICPDSKTICPEGSTCCKLLSGQYGCCPYLKAACCNDGIHCCPNGYTCDVSHGTCKQGTITIKASTKSAAIGDIFCPDQTSTCPDGMTCCKMSTGKFGCCPYSKATCCSDGVHCCPNGFTCDVAQGTCSQGALTMEAFSKVAAIGKIQCPDGKSACPDETTCCKMSTGGYGCCPSPKAVCCSDGLHCCPNGYTCDVSKGTCTQGKFSLVASTKISALENVIPLAMIPVRQVKHQTQTMLFMLEEEQDE